MTIYELEKLNLPIPVTLFEIHKGLMIDYNDIFCTVSIDKKIEKWLIDYIEVDPNYTKLYKACITSSL